MRLGAAHGLECPVNQTLVAIIKHMERQPAGTGPWQPEGRGNAMREKP